MPTTTTTPRLTASWNKGFALSVISVIIRKVITRDIATPVNLKTNATSPRAQESNNDEGYRGYSNRELLIVRPAPTAMPSPPRSSTAICIRGVAVANVVAVTFISSLFAGRRPGVAASATAAASASIAMFSCS